MNFYQYKLIPYQISEKFRTIVNFHKIIKNKKNRKLNLKNNNINKEILIQDKINACQMIIKNMKKLKVKKENRFKRDNINYLKEKILNILFRFLIKLKIKKDPFSKLYIQKFPYIINASLIKKKSKVLFPNSNFFIYDQANELIEISSNN